MASDYCLACVPVSYGRTQPQAFQVPAPLTAHRVRFQLPSVLPFERSDSIAGLSGIGPPSCAELEMIACTLPQTRSYLFCDVSCPDVSSSYPLCCFGGKPVQNSRFTCLVDVVPDSSSLSLNLGNSMAYGLQRPAGVPVCTAGARKVLLKQGPCILMYAFV